MNNDMPLVSVVIPTYNRPVYLKRCIESVLAQTYNNIEILVVDDNNPNTESRILTEQVMCMFLKNYKIKYIQHENNKNGSAARNTGWKHASGKYITYLDDDDVISVTKIQKQVECLEKLDDTWGCCYTGYKLIKEHGDYQISTEKRQGNCYIDALMRTMYMGSGSNLFLRKKVVDEINGYDESFQRNQDIEFLTRVLERYKIAYVDDILLTIYQEGERTERTFEEIESYTEHYLTCFKNKINSLPSREKERVISVISLERCRMAFYKKRYRMGIRILEQNHIKIRYIVRYVVYLLKRKITHQSYGFQG